MNLNLLDPEHCSSLSSVPTTELKVDTDKAYDLAVRCTRLPHKSVHVKCLISPYNQTYQWCQTLSRLHFCCCIKCPGKHQVEGGRLQPIMAGKFRKMLKAVTCIASKSKENVALDRTECRCRAQPAFCLTQCWERMLPIFRLNLLISTESNQENSTCS